MTEPRRYEHDAAPDLDRPIAPGGWRRALLGLLIGALAGAAIAFVLPRDDLPRRSPQDDWES